MLIASIRCSFLINTDNIVSLSLATDKENGNFRVDVHTANGGKFELAAYKSDEKELATYVHNELVRAWMTRAQNVILDTLESEFHHDH